MIVRHRFRYLIVPLALGAMAVAIAAGCGGGDSASGSKLTLVAYSTPQEVYAKLIPAFQKTTAGQGISFDQSYGASGEQRRAVEAGLPASVVAFSLEPDITSLVDKDIVAPDWNANPSKGFVSDSVVAFVVRKGNPKHITTWDDLVKPGIEVITPNPFTSGGAKWNIMAAYGAQIALGKTKQQGLEYIAALFKNVPVQNKSAREALQTFAAGKGDVLIAYENEAILAQTKGQDVDYLIPDQTLLIENPIAATKGSPAAAQAFVDFALTPASQRVFGDNGYRPVDKKVLAEFKFPVPPKLFTIDDLGGWKSVNTEFFDADNGAVAKIFAGQGIATK